ncbi:hypothetical protein AeNC1_011447 [Aphanomyces euteiches]|nr:hypothetical protein AeNC1_011447 [Aphanomyces euteiches]
MSTAVGAAVVPLITAASAAAAVWTLSRRNSPQDSIDSRLDALHRAVVAKQSQDASSTSSTKAAEVWLASLDQAMRAIVTIRIMKVRSFDDEKAACTVATGFVVDKERGLILTNRHVVTPGPVVADAIFVNHEEVDLVPIYRDPVHDFGFFRFDPSAVRFLDLHEIPLRPDLARVGTDIRVVGNDNAEKVQILPGVLAKLDRAAPNYGSTGYSDFNTFYYAAASSTSGGSSGSPVLNIDGAAVALNAGGATNAASSYYLPLDRVKRALSFLQDGELHIPRGTWQTIFRHVAFDEARQLGLSADQERTLRSTLPQVSSSRGGGGGVLVVDQVLPEGPAAGFLEPGDVVISIASSVTTTFTALETILDDHIGHAVSIEIQRGRHCRRHFDLVVQDLDSITPREFLEVGNCIIHALSYHQARNYNLPVGGVYVTQIGHLLLHANVFYNCLVVKLDGELTPTLDAFVNILQRIPQGTRTDLTYVLPGTRRVWTQTVVTIDLQWYPTQLWRRHDHDGLWHASKLDPPALFRPENPPQSNGQVVTPLKTESQWATKLLSAMVYVRYEAPLEIDGIGFTSFEAIGYIVDAKRGYVLVDKCTVHLFMAHVTVIVAASIQLTAAIRFVHPVHNFALVQFDPAELGDSSAILSAIPMAKASKPPPHVGSTVDFVGLTSLWSVLTAKAVVTKLDRFVLTDLGVPRYKSCPVEVFEVEPMNSSALGGVFVNEEHQVVGFWFEFGTEDSSDGQFSQSVHRGLPIAVVADLVSAIQAGETPPKSIRILPIELTTTSVATARAGLGLSPSWIEKLAAKHPDTRQVLTVFRCAAESQARDTLQSGDLVLAVQGQPVVKDSDVEKLCSSATTVELTVLRHGNQLTLSVDTIHVSALGTTRAVLWCGLLLQAPHWTVYQRGFVPGKVYVSMWMHGSPADKYGMEPRRFILQVNEIPTPDLDAFLDAVRDVKQGDSVRLHMVTMATTRPEMRTLKTEYHYWPTMQVEWHAPTESWKTTYPHSHHHG